MYDLADVHVDTSIDDKHLFKYMLKIQPKER